jgi:hypothetical protein
MLMTPAHPVAADLDWEIWVIQTLPDRTTREIRAALQELARSDDAAMQRMAAAARLHLDARAAPPWDWNEALELGGILVLIIALCAPLYAWLP